MSKKINLWLLTILLCCHFCAPSAQGMWDNIFKEEIGSTICVNLSETELESVSQVNKHWREFFTNALLVTDLLYCNRIDLLKWLDERKFINKIEIHPHHLYNLAMNNFEATDWLLNHGVSFKALGNDETFSLLLYYGSNLEKLQWLIDHGANVNACVDSEPLLSCFLQQNDFEAAKVLITNDAKIYLENRDGISPHSFIKDNRDLVLFTHNCVKAGKNNSKRPDKTSVKDSDKTKISFRFSNKSKPKRVQGNKDTTNLRKSLIREEMTSKSSTELILEPNKKSKLLDYNTELKLFDTEKALRLLEFSKNLILNSTFFDFNHWQQGLLKLAGLNVSWARELHKQGSRVLYASLDLSYPEEEGKLGVDGSRMISKIFRDNVNLTTLNLSGHSLEDAGVTSIVEALSTTYVLTKLDLSNNKIGVPGAVSLSNLLTVNLRLKELNLALNSIKCEGMSAIVQSLLANTSLQKLNVCLNDIKDEGIQFFDKVLTRNTTLEELNLSNNEIALKGTETLSCGLRVNSSLTTLYLTDNLINCEGMTTLGNSLLSNNSLRILDLSNNLIQDEGIKAFGNVLAVNRGLTELDLSNNEIGSEGVGFLRQGITDNSTLAYINLINTGYWQDKELVDLCKEKDITLSIDFQDDEDEYEEDEDEYGHDSDT